ncbi:hypothetical protein L2750_13890 [Shewanella submarina]|uniref:Uncharacterized protein n=1 Tax=Shewanella submarina TaxID=2016376 RepID=A0ABV7GHQ7_9GAMM|nr:hypothetical protein [Shewanella submarina]MCL1038235.1 hypothetical protein [Shewanella submarina]
MDEIRELCGQPEFIEHFAAIESRPEDRSVLWRYSNGIDLDFGSDYNFRLGSITLTSPLVKLEDKTVIGRPINDVLLDFPTIELDDDFAENGHNYILPGEELSIWVNKSVVENITVFPNYDKSGNIPMWPEKGS